MAYVYGAQLAAFDFSNPESPAARNTLWFDGWNSSAVLATDRFFFIASTIDYLSSAIHVVDISSLEGTMVAKGTIQTAGIVVDKFKMGLNGDVFTAISRRSGIGRVKRLKTSANSKPFLSPIRTRRWHSAS